ncbi:MAG: type 4a pilus biogenesis protein PilO [Thermodesulfobacteriota bacterium]
MMTLTLPPKRTLIAAILPVVAVVGLLMYYFAFVSVASQITILKASISTITFPSIREVGANRAEPGDRVAEMRRINELFHRKFPDTPSVPQSLSWLIHAASDVGITGISFKTGDKVHGGFVPIGGKEIYQWPITLRFRSDYYQLAQLVHKISNAEREIDIIEVEISRGAPRIVTRLDLAVYSFE